MKVSTLKVSYVLVLNVSVLNEMALISKALVNCATVQDEKDLNKPGTLFLMVPCSKGECILELHETGSNK